MQTEKASTALAGVMWGDECGTATKKYQKG
jgi:hypothetical protein